MADGRKNNGGRRSGAGRAKGQPNKMTAKVKDAIMGAFDELGGMEYLVRVGRSDPKTYITLLSKVLPAEIKADVEASIITQVMPSIKDSDGNIMEYDLK